MQIHSDARSEAWLDVIRRIHRRQIKSQIVSGVRFLGVALFFILPPAILYALLTEPKSGQSGARPGDWLEGLLIVSLWTLLLTFLTFTFFRQVPAEDLYDVERIDDVIAVSELTRLLCESSSEDLRSACSMALVRLLSRMSDADIAHVDKTQRTRLCKRLQIARAHSEFKLQMAILDLLKRGGWPESLPFIRQLSESRWTNNYQERICAAATAALPVIEARIKKSSKQENLLRPVDSPADSLLRPLKHDASVDVASLLRPDPQMVKETASSS